MTKSNKTLLCCLLTCVMVLACALTLLQFNEPITANAAETVVTFTIAPAGASNTEIKNAFDLTAKDAKDNSYTITLDSLTKVYPNNGAGVKLGSKSAAGSFSFALLENTTKVEVFAKYFSSSETSLKIGDETFTTEGDYASYSVDITTETSITVSANKRAYVNAIVLYLSENTEHTHTWGEWKHVEGTETHARTCTADATHKETENCTFNESNKCTVCGYTKVAEHEHNNWGELVVIEEATCTTAGSGLKECLEAGCKGTLEVTIPALGHQWNDGEVTKPATCTEKGVKTFTCTREGCNETKTEEIAVLDHQWNDGEITTAATCTTDGVKTFTCTREGCGETKTETIAATGHDYGADGKCTVCGEEKPYTILPTDFDGSKYTSGEITTSSGLTISATDAMMRESAIQLKASSGSLLIKNIAATKVCISIKLNGISVFATDGDGNKLGDAIVGSDGVYLVTNPNSEGILIKAGDKYAQLIKIEIYGTVHTHEWGEWKHVENTETHERVCLTNENHKETGNCNFVNDICTVCGYDKSPKQFTVTETVTAVENGSILNNGTMYILPNGQIDVVYNVTANSGINALEGTIAWNAELFDFVSMTAGNIFGENNVTVSGESATTKKIAVTIGASNNATGVLLTVRYQLKAGVTAEQLANAKFGFTADVLFGTDTTTKVTNTATENTVPMSVRQDATLTVNGVDYTAEDRTITLTYNGQDITAGTEEGSVLKIATNHTGYNADCLTWTVVKNAGNYELKIAIAADGAYNAIAEVTYKIVVKQVEIASTNIAIINNTTSKDLLGGNAKWTEADFTITYNGETLPDEFRGLYQIAIVDGEVAQATAKHTLTVELTLTAEASVNYMLTGTDVAEGKLSKQFEVSVVNAAIDISGMPDNVERAYNAQAIDLSGVSVEEGATLKIYVALNDGAEAEVTENLDTYVKNVGNYVVRFEAHKNANVYSQTRTYTITKCDLTKVTLTYNGDTVTWTDTQTNGETVVVKYTIAATEITNNAYTATQKNTEEVKLVVSTDNANYNGYELTLANVFSVTFADDKHETATQYRFENQLATSITPNAVGGFAFDGWYVTNGETEIKYDFTKAVTADVNLTAKWTALTFTVTLMDGETTLNTIDNVAYEALLSTLEITDASKADDEDNYYTFVGWTLTAEGETIDLATTKVTDNMTLYAKFTSASNKFTLTWTLTYNGNAVENGTLTVKRNTALNEIAGLPTSKNANVLTIGTWKNGENVFTAMPTADVEITAAYEIALQAGDVNGDGKVNLDDVVLFRKYLVGGYAMDVVADENIYTAITAEDAASKTMFFKYSANMDNDANLDIRDVATIRMNVVATTEGGEEQTQTTQSAARMEVFSEAVQYAVLPKNKFVA